MKARVFVVSLTLFALAVSVVSAEEAAPLAPIPANQEEGTVFLEPNYRFQTVQELIQKGDYKGADGLLARRIEDLKLQYKSGSFEKSFRSNILDPLTLGYFIKVYLGDKEGALAYARTQVQPGVGLDRPTFEAQVDQFLAEAKKNPKAYEAMIGNMAFEMGLMLRDQDANDLEKKGDEDGALAAAQETWALAHAAYGKTHDSRMIPYMSRVVYLMKKRGAENKELLAIYEKALPVYEKQYGPASDEFQRVRGLRDELQRKLKGA